MSFDYVRLGLDCDEKQQNARLRFFCESRALFTGSTSMDFSKFFFKTGSHGIIHTFKNYFATVFSVFNNKRYPNSSLKKNTTTTFSLPLTTSHVASYGESCANSCSPSIVQTIVLKFYFILFLF